MIENVTTIVTIGMVIDKILDVLFGNFENIPANNSGIINPISVGAKT